MKLNNDNLKSGWTETVLGECLEVINGRAYKLPEMLDSGTPILRIQNLNKGDRWFYMYQAKNICTVVCAEKILKGLGFNLTNENQQYALANVKKITGMQGRWDVLQTKPTIITDVAHNKEGIKLLLEQLETNYPKANLHFVLGFVKDKDVAGVLQLFPQKATYYFTNAHIPRALAFQEDRKSVV